MIISTQGKSNSSRSFNLRSHSLFIPLRRTLEKVAFYGLLLTVIAAGIPYGVVDSSLNLLFVCLIYLFSAFRVVESLLGGSFALGDRILFGPLIGLLSLAVIQILPLSILPSLLSGSQNTSSYISLDYYETGNFILLFGSLLLLADTLRHCARTRKRLIAILVTVIVVGVGSALFGVIRQMALVFLNSSLLVYDISSAQYAQFVNRNHFALLIEMTLGILLGLILKASPSSAWKVSCWIIIALCWFVIISANSRGGIMSAAGVILFAALIHFVTNTYDSKSHMGERADSSRRSLKLALAIVPLMALLLGALIVSVSFVGGDTVVSRFEKTDKEFAPIDNGGSSRIEIWQSTISLIRTFPVSGVGFGAYGKAITAFDASSNGEQPIEEAHNEYLEIVASGGILAAILTLLFLGVLLNRTIQQLKCRKGFERAICLGALLGISGVLLHSVVDFGLHVLINALVFVLLIVLATARLENNGDVAG